MLIIAIALNAPTPLGNTVHPIPLFDGRDMGQIGDEKRLFLALGGAPYPDFR